MIDVETLYTAARQLTTDLLPRLAAEIPEQPTTLESSIGSHRKHVAAPIPWNQPAAMLFLEIHGDARRYENLLTLRLFGHAKYRGGTDHQTTECINRLPVLIAHGIDKQLDALDLADPARDLAAWPRRVRTVLDELGDNEQPWTRAPGDLRCPYCDRALELEPGWTHHPETADVVCRRCRDAHGQTLRWEPTTWVAVLQHRAAS